MAEKEVPARYRLGVQSISPEDANEEPDETAQALPDDEDDWSE